MINTFLNDTIFDGAEQDFAKIALCASYHAVLVLGIENHVTGDPPIFFPTNPGDLPQFMEKYSEMFDSIRDQLESAGALLPAEDSV